MKKTILLGAALALSAQAFAAQTDFGAGTAAMPWLKAENNAKSSGMANLFAGGSGDVNAITINPAGLAGLKGQQVALMHNVGFQGQATEHAAWGMGLGNATGVGLSVDYINFGTVETFSVNSGGQLAQGADLAPSGLSVAGGFGQKIGSVAVGATAKFVREDLGVADASSVAADLGLAMGDGRYSLGLSVLNLGGQVNGSNLPSSVRAGGAYRLEVASNQAVKAGLEVSAPFADFGASLVGLGAEYAYGGAYALRLGYKLGAEQAPSGLTAGAGLRFGAYGLDYAYEALGDLGSSSRISAVLGF